MGMAVKLSDDLVNDARQEAAVTDRSLTSQIEYWARLGRTIERVLQHEEILNIKRTGELPSAPPTRRAVLSALRQVASEASRRDFASELRSGRTVYQDAGDSRIERIEPDGTRAIGRFVNRHFVEDPEPTPRRK